MKFSKENAHLSEKKFTILHLSDLHFGPKNKYDAKSKYQKSYGSYKKTLIDDIREDINELSKRPDCIIVSGDLTEGTEGAQETEFETCRLFLIDLCKAFNLNVAKDLVVTPGNHDVYWNAPVDKMENYRVFFEKLFGEDSNKFFCMVRGFKGDVNVTVVGLNSCIVESKQVPGIGSVGSGQLKFVEKKMKDQGIDSREFIKIAIMHHHLVPVKPVELIEFDKDSHELKSFSLTHDSGYILTWLKEHGFSIVLHGHQHQGFLGSERRADKNRACLSDEVLVLGVGSIAIDPNETVEGFNSYNLIEIDGLGRMTVETRKSKGPGKGWGFVQECTYHLPLPGSIETAIADTLENIVEKGNSYLSDFAYLSNIEKTVIRLLAVLGAIRFEKNVPIMNDYPKNKAELGTSLVGSLFAHVNMPSEVKVAFFNGWENFLSSDSAYSIRQIVKQSETRRLNVLKEGGRSIMAQEEEYVLFILAGRLIDTEERCCLMRWNIGWDKDTDIHRAYLVPAQRAGLDALSNFCFHDLGVEPKKLNQHLTERPLDKLQEIKVSPKSGLVTKYSFEARLIKVDKEGRELINSKAKHPFDNRIPPPRSQEHEFKWYTEEECEKDKYMMEVNGTVVKWVFKYINNLDDDDISFEVK